MTSLQLTRKLSECCTRCGQPAGDTNLCEPHRLDRMSAVSMAPSATSMAPARSERICRACDEPFVLGSRNECASCRTKRREQAKIERALARVATKHGRQQAMRESVVDVGQAIAELQRAEVEMAAIPTGLLKHQRQAALVEPLSRLQLVRRFVDGVLRRHGPRIREAK